MFFASRHEAALGSADKVDLGSGADVTRFRRQLLLGLASVAVPFAAIALNRRWREFAGKRAAAAIAAAAAAAAAQWKGGGGRRRRRGNAVSPKRTDIISTGNHLK